MTRTLTLKREALARLTDDDLAGVAGGVRRYTLLVGTCPVRECVGFEDSELATCYGCQIGA